ncbi:MAG: tetratricopeptide repeat protein [Pyrinomonadaceae bacterium]
MKRCPDCGRDYNDDSLSFCLDDGSELLFGPKSFDEPQTAILHETAHPSEAATRAQIHTTAAEPQSRLGQPAEKHSFSANRAAKPLMIAGGVLLLLVAGFFGYRYFYPGTGQINSIAVMPFVNESGDPEIEYLSDGMTEDLISSLTEIRDLSVKARSTVFYYKGKNLSPKEIGEELKVDAVLLGRVVQRGDALKLNLELVDANTLDAIWSKSYDRKMNELVDVQSEIARNVSLRLRSRLTGEEQQEVAGTGTRNSEAQQLYLKGRFYWNKRNIADFERAEDHFRRAIEKDPAYALAYTGLADTFSLKPYFGNFRPKEYFPKARQAVEKALELNPELPEAYASLGQLSSFEYDFSGADRAYKKAIELDPKFAGAHQWYAENLAYMGRYEEALKEIDIALELEPLSLIINHSKGFILEETDRTDEAIAQGEKTVELFPTFAMTHSNLSRQYAAKGNYEKAAEHNFRELELAGIDPEQIRRIKAAYEKDGWKGLWTARLEMELATRKSILDKDPSAFAWCNYIAWAYAALKDKEKTLEYLNLSYEQREPAMVDIRTDLSFDFLKGDPRFEELIEKVGFPTRK